MARRDVTIGQRYQPVDGNSVWEVQELVKDPEGIVHARLVRVGDPLVGKMISGLALRDAKLYRLLPGYPLPQE